MVMWYHITTSSRCGSEVWLGIETEPGLQGFTAELRWISHGQRWNTDELRDSMEKTGGKMDMEKTQRN